MHTRPQHPRAGEVTLHDLFLVLLLVMALIGGLIGGIRIGSSYGPFAQILGAIVGPIVAIVAVCGTLLLLCAIIVVPFERFCRWWRPDPPTCENGTCNHEGGYTPYQLPDEVVQRWKGLSRYADRCQCGYVYGSGYEAPLRSRWVRVLPDGTLRPYLRYRPFGRWKPDDPDSIVAVPRVPPPPAHRLPGWILPLMMVGLCGGMAFVVVRRDFGASPHAWPFVICCAVLGLLIGAVCGYFRPSDEE